MAKGYWVVHLTVKDKAGYPAYQEVVGRVFAQYGGRFLVRGGEAQTVEGGTRERHVVVEFDTYERAVECYNSPEYAEGIRLRKAFSDADFVIVGGVD